jgi:RNA polymerase sigma-70 factor (ECF subfamily)
MDELETLVRRAQALDSTVAQRHEAFGALVRRFQDMAYGYAYAALGDMYLAEDVAQEAFLTAYRSLHQLLDPHAFPGWLRRIVLTECSRMTRRKQLRTEPLTTIPHASTPGDEPVAVAEAHELRAAVVSALQALPERERLPALLFVIGDYRPNEIARFLELPVTTVRKRLQRARLHLQERMVDVARDEFRQRRPSKDEQFAHAVQVWSAFDAVAAEGDVAVLELLLLDGVHVDVRDSAGRTLLLRTVQQGHLDAAALLLRHGADVNARDHAGTTALRYAQNQGQPELVHLLRGYGGTA